MNRPEHPRAEGLDASGAARQIMLPRLAELGEHYDDHQAEITDAFVQRGLVLQARNVDDLRAALTAVSLSIPVANGRPVLGTWQGIYLFEHRATPHRRRVALHLIGE